MDWPAVIMQINKAGLSGAQIAERIGVAHSTINGLKNGHWDEPRYSLGAKLIDLRDRLKQAGLIDG